MGSFFLGLVIVAVAIAITFYCIGLSIGRREVAAANYRYQITKFENAMNKAKDDLATAHTVKDKLASKISSEVLGLKLLMKQYHFEQGEHVANIRGDLVAAQSFNEHYFKIINSSGMFTKRMVLMCGEQLENAPFAITHERFSEVCDDYSKRDREEEKSDLEHAKRWSARDREAFMNEHEESLKCS
ncbi:hypothetical protein OGX96_19080 [Citrobacter sp. Cpo100]|uniref:hypothetical protein n=1 Tax=Citrobacter sp. Cpo100 TaxID=2985141 RepID=UPI0025761138|nr:hypothetical protein [Citrobacter sp. Cpo100]MDM2823176.1 hypothetical protein [Citrobacter sp. Cpo100]